MNALPTTSLEAYEAYLRGRQRWEARTADSTAQAVELFLKATELDPNFAEAWAGLGDAYRHQAAYGGLPELEVFPKATEAINKALALNPNLAEAHAALGGLTQQRDGDQARAKYHLERAIELNPSYSSAYNWLGLLYGKLAQFDKSIEIFSRGQRIDPLSAVIASNLAYAVGDAGRHDEMKRRLDQFIEKHPESPFGYYDLANYQFEVKGRVDEALRAMLQATLADPNDPKHRVIVSYFLGILGDQPASSGWLSSAFALQPEYPVAKGIRVLSYIENGLLDKAMEEAQQITANNGKASHYWLYWIAQLLNNAYIDSGNPQAAIARYVEVYKEYWGDDPRPLDILGVDAGIEMVRLLRASGDTEKADVLLDEVTSVLEAAPVVGSTGSGFMLAAAYTMADRREVALAALRSAIDAGVRVDWRYHFDHNRIFEALHDSPKFKEMRIELAADMQKQLENARRMQANGHMPTVPGMELFSQSEQSGTPPI